MGDDLIPGTWYLSRSPSWLENPKAHVAHMAAIMDPVVVVDPPPPIPVRVADIGGNPAVEYHNIWEDLLRDCRNQLLDDIEKDRWEMLGPSSYRLADRMAQLEDRVSGMVKPIKDDIDKLNDEIKYLKRNSPSMEDRAGSPSRQEMERQARDIDDKIKSIKKDNDNLSDQNYNRLKWDVDDLEHGMKALEKKLKDRDNDDLYDEQNREPYDPMNPG